MKKFAIHISEKQSTFLSLWVGVSFVLFVAFLLYANIEPLSPWLNFLENHAYDLELRASFKPLNSSSSVVIVDIDNDSLAQEGRWPWPRKTLATVLEKLQNLGAKVVAFDLMFPEPQENMGTLVLQELEKTSSPLSPEAEDALKKAEECFDYDALFAQALEKGTSVLGMFWTAQDHSLGALPPPFITLPEELAHRLDLLHFENYLSNIPPLQSAAKFGGFLNASPDVDGVNRFAPLLIQRGAEVYASLALQATTLYLSSKKKSLIIEKYPEALILESIQLDELRIPTTPSGQILIPFRGNAYCFPYVSATDLLHDRVSKETVEGKLIFVGSSASALGDFVPTAIGRVYPGIEIHATIAQGIIDQYFPYKPTWAKGVVVSSIVFFGLLCACTFPFVSPIIAALLTIFSIGILYFLGQWLWQDKGLVISFFLPNLVILSMYIFDTFSGFLFETKRRRTIRNLFAHYLPPVYVDQLCKSGSELGLQGENKELSVLFSDIRGFTTISEKMSAAEVKEFLSIYFTEMTTILFNHGGTIDKYIGDAIMAFWGAPIEDKQHALHAVSAALAMQASLQHLNITLKNAQKPPIQIGVGINTGMLHVGDMGSKYRLSYTALGDAVNLASRLEGLTKHYRVGIVVGQNTYRQTKEAFIYRKLDKVQVKGKHETIEIYQPLCTPEALTKQLQKELAEFETAMNTYYQREWKEAETLFERLMNTYPENFPLYETYLLRIRHTPLPPPAWDGSIIMETK